MTERLGTCQSDKAVLVTGRCISERRGCTGEVEAALPSEDRAVIRGTASSKDVQATGGDGAWTMDKTVHGEGRGGSAYPRDAVVLMTGEGSADRRDKAHRMMSAH